MGRVRASVRGHCAQPGARTKAARSAPPHRCAARYGAQHRRQARADALTLDASAWRAVEPACATARGSDVFALVQGSKVASPAMAVERSCLRQHTPVDLSQGFFCPMGLHFKHVLEKASPFATGA